MQYETNPALPDEAGQPETAHDKIMFWLVAITNARAWVDR
jgi:hypothetical protein